MQWTTTVPMWPTCSPLDVMARLQTGITDTFADRASVGDSIPRAASLPRPTSSEMGGVYGTSRRAGGPIKNGYPRALGCFAASATIHLATEQRHSNGHASVTPDDAAHGAARRHRSERERRLLRDRRRAAGQLLVLSAATANVTDHDVTDLLIELETGLYVRGRVDPGGRARGAMPASRPKRLRSASASKSAASSFGSTPPTRSRVLSRPRATPKVRSRACW